MKHYKYTDHKNGNNIVFECDAESILDADKLYQEKIGKHPQKQAYVGCEVISNGTSTVPI